MDTLTEVLGIFGQTVINVYRAFSFEFFGMKFNALDIVLWFTIAVFVIDLIRDFTDL